MSPVIDLSNKERLLEKSIGQLNFRHLIFPPYVQKLKVKMRKFK